MTKGRLLLSSLGHWSLVIGHWSLEPRGRRGRFAGNGQGGSGGSSPATLFFFRLERRATDSRTYDIGGNVKQALLARGGREMNGFTEHQASGASEASKNHGAVLTWAAAQSMLPLVRR